MASLNRTLIEVCHAEKSFGANKVLIDMNFELLSGEVHALVGENGAGKSTTLGLMYGLIQPDVGEVKVLGRSERIESPSHAQELGIGCVFQELSLAGALSVAENIFVGRMPTKFGVIDRPVLIQKAESLLAEFGVYIDVTMPVDSLPISTRQLVEIAKALSLNSQVLLLDEPTSALTPDEVQSLFVVLRKLAQKGIGIVYVSHHMSEIFEIADRITALRDGRRVSTAVVSETSVDRVITDMVGGEIPKREREKTSELGTERLSVNNLSFPGLFDDVSFSLQAGEIVGLAGLMGSNRSVIAKALVGLHPYSDGDMKVNGESVDFHSLPEAMEAGIGYVPEERKTEGLFLDFSVRDNLTVSSLKSHANPFGFLSEKSASKVTEEAIKRFRIKTEDQDIPLASLSGGNQQKVMLAKWLERNPDVLVIDEPTKGVDIGAKFQIHAELRKCAEKGMSILVVSSDFPELTILADRIVVVREGRITGEVKATDASENTILELAAGVSQS
ncbi:sugar ABC transporter ATP-binding protein [Enterovibrio calviensis]|uniref:sugar ABC transporter ATP-binding protein n=1 Tax=Enterovibrio calviensis TaxID=91359 RepID=UPI000483CB83|nr:sugar ABC transporter ATP-binding protein [Enterovibrio calviensis]